jgi:[ribosomal protein S5]-alanine N-acetyltransferase
MIISPTNRWCGEQIELFLLDEAGVSQSYVDWLNDTSVNRYLESRFSVHSLESTREFVRNCLSDPSTLLLGIRARVFDGRHVGNIKLGPIDWRHGLGEVGILVGEPAAWGRGIGCDAIRLLASIAERELKLSKLSAGCYASNVGSERAFLKAGFQIEGRRPSHFSLGQRRDDALLFGLALQERS